MAGGADGRHRCRFPDPAARGAANLDAGAPEILLGAEPAHRPDREIRHRRQPRDGGQRRHRACRQPEGAGGAAVGCAVLLGKRPAPGQGGRDGGHGRRSGQRHLPQQAGQPGRPGEADRGPGARNRPDGRCPPRSGGRGGADLQGRPAKRDGRGIPGTSRPYGPLLRGGRRPRRRRARSLRNALQAAGAIGRGADRTGLDRRGAGRQDRHPHRVLGHRREAHGVEGSRSRCGGPRWG